MLFNLKEMSKPSQQERRRRARRLCLFLQHCAVCHLSPWLEEKRIAVSYSRFPTRLLRLAPFCCSRRSHNRQAQSVRPLSHHMGGRRAVSSPSSLKAVDLTVVLLLALISIKYPHHMTVYYYARGSGMEVLDLMGSP